MRPCRTLVALALGVMLAATLAACARKGPPAPPPGQPDTFNRTYPSE